MGLKANVSLLVIQGSGNGGWADQGPSPIRPGHPWTPSAGGSGGQHTRHHWGQSDRPWGPKCSILTQGPSNQAAHFRCFLLPCMCGNYWGGRGMDSTPHKEKLPQKALCKEMSISKPKQLILFILRNIILKYISFRLKF